MIEIHRRCSRCVGMQCRDSVVCTWWCAAGANHPVARITVILTRRSSHIRSAIAVIGGGRLSLWRVGALHPARIPPRPAVAHRRLRPGSSRNNVASRHAPSHGPSCAHPWRHLLPSPAISCQAHMRHHHPAIPPPRRLRQPRRTTHSRVNSRERARLSPRIGQLGQRPSARPAPVSSRRAWGRLRGPSAPAGVPEGPC